MTQLEALIGVNIDLTSIKDMPVNLNRGVQALTGQKFADVLHSTTFAEPTSATKGKDPAKINQANDVAKSFETMLISQFIGKIFANQTDGFFGDGFQGDFYSSLFSNAVAKQLSERGGFGFAKMVEPK